MLVKREWHCRVWLGAERLGNMMAEQGGVYSIVITREPGTSKTISLTHMLTTPNTVHMFWLLPQIIIITIVSQLSVKHESSGKYDISRGKSCSASPASSSPTARLPTA